MPKITFHNLPNDKKELLIQALRKEFSRVPLFEASIANIIKAANIPRGSFYQYFDDKEDAYYYLLSELTNQVKNQFLWVLKKHKGDLFEAVIEFFKTVIEEEDNYSFMKNAFLNMNHKIEETLSEIFANKETVDQFDLIQKQIDKERLNVSSNEDLVHVMTIISAVTFHNFIERFSRDITNEQALQNVKSQIELLRVGLEK
ncbi:TetR/AcrR family transcriptional regulator [Aquibacillus koreensis]|uniref:TetR/AcrR family transcriptional regulator n=1 Tax=Aquibacillus koreensis TaxID=279446 RepID=A0A9X4AK41_9BACI|nr:TetR/AcrR family transcriptional regulator [Aquibacillus koreensis]MCT2535506.1 TetR/AcrR family transcriptional regulator [Aquibacillus koreensis]MDC3422681.1 TetR/AcrR family transcriptional regulator [Aquibacillus koreensis]